MGFVLTLIYVVITLVSPGVFPIQVATLHIVFILGIATILATSIEVPRSKIYTVPDTYLAVGLLVATVFSTIATGWFGGGFATFMDFFPLLACFLFIIITCQSLRRLKILVFVLLMTAFYILAQGAIAAYTGDPQSPYILYPNPLSIEPPLYRHRGLGILADPNDLAQFLVMLIPLLFLRWKKGQTSANFLFTLVPACILIAGIYYTHSRGAVLALVAVLLFGFKDKLSIVGSSIVAGGAMLGLLALNVGGGRGMSEDDGERVAFWAQGLSSMKQHPIFGIGFGNFADINHGRAAHNSYVLGMVELGVVGYFFWIGMIVSAWSGLSNVIRWKGKQAPLSTSAAEEQLPNSRGLQPIQPIPALAVALNSPGLAARHGLAARSYGNASPELATPAPALPLRSAPSIRGLIKDMAADQDLNSEQLVTVAKVVHTAFVGVLVTSMFLSRTYAMPLYILLGIAVCVIRIAPSRASLDALALSKRTLLFVFLSVAFIYGFVRWHGGK